MICMLVNYSVKFCLLYYIFSFHIFSLQRQLYWGPRKPLDQLLPAPTSTAQNGTISSTSVSTSTDTTAFKELSKDSSTAGIDNSLLDGSFSYKPMVLLPSVGFGTALGLHQSPKLVKSKSRFSCLKLFKK